MAEEPKKDMEKTEEKAVMAESPPAQTEETEKPEDMKVMMEKYMQMTDANTKALEELAARVSQIQEALDAVAKEEEGETKEENNKIEVGDSNLATYAKDVQAVKDEVAGVRKMLEPMVAHFSSMGFKKTISSQVRVESDPNDMTATFEKMNIL